MNTNTETQLSIAQRLAAGLLHLNPGQRFAYHRDGYAVAVWNATLARWQTCVSHAITGEWVTLEYEPTINGKPACSDLDWQECQGEAA